ncbi:hypothetical protein GQ600_9812 [Phytophthora cactorum]|nr:hypothetical protein GQ600_9812 [Phytophthora cactorum]
MKAVKWKVRDYKALGSEVLFCWWLVPVHVSVRDGEREENLDPLDRLCYGKADWLDIALTVSTTIR